MEYFFFSSYFHLIEFKPFIHNFKLPNIYISVYLKKNLLTLYIREYTIFKFWFLSLLNELNI